MTGENILYRNCISQNGNALINQITEYGRFPETEKLMLVVKSLQSQLLYENGDFIVPGKSKRHGKLHIDKLRQKIYSSTK